MIQLRFPKGLVALLQSYLSNRQFQATIDDSKSPTLSIANGAPQGSILGPVLFLIYVKDSTNRPAVLSLRNTHTSQHSISAHDQ